MTYHHKQYLLLVTLSLLYSLLFYFLLTNQLQLDFYSFYSASSALLDGNNPYQSLIATYLPTAKKLSANLNPPILLMLFAPLSKLNHHTALLIWSMTSFILGLIAATAAFKLAFPDDFFKKNWLCLYLIYLSLFSTLMNAHIAQLGSFIAFCLITGYYCYRQGRYTLVGILWGLIIAIKLFPGLLFVYVARQRRYKMLAVMATTVFCLWLIPLLVYGTEIYSNYFNMLSRVLWYGDSWNASLYGFLFRVFVNTQAPNHLGLMKAVYCIVCLGLVAWYIKKVVSIKTPEDTNHQSFCLTLVVMLLISPLGWMYYFPFILLPLLITWSQATERSYSAMFAWLVCLFLVNFPIDYIETKNMHSFIEKVSIDSFYFYGLLLLTYLVSKDTTYSHHPAPSKSDSLILPIASILGFGAIMLGFSFWRVAR